MPKRKQNELGKSPFSIRLSALRKEKGLNMEKLAAEIGVSKSFISLLESGGRQPSREVVLKLAASLHSGEPENLRDELLVLAGFAPVNTRAISAYQDALQVYEQALAENPADFRTFSRLIMALIKSQRYALAQERIQQGLMQFTESVHMQSLLAQLELSKGNYKAAVLNQETALKQYEMQTAHPTLHADLIFNLGAIYFMQGHALMGQAPDNYASSPHAQALKAFESARSYFEQALAESPDDAYILDEYARLLFNQAYLQQTDAAWQTTIQAYRRLLTHPAKASLGPQPLMESAAFLAHAYTQNHDYDQAELTLGLLSSFNPDYWLVHYLQACLHSQRHGRLGKPEDLDAGLKALELALANDPHGHVRHEAAKDPDLAVLRSKRKSAFEKLLTKEKTPA